LVLRLEGLLEFDGFVPAAALQLRDRKSKATQIRTIMIEKKRTPIIINKIYKQQDKRQTANYTKRPMRTLTKDHELTTLDQTL
jgi:hypothetical protein